MLRLLKTLGPLLLALLVQLSANAQGKSLLWKVTGKGLSAPSYLFGTMHLVCKNDLSFAPAVTDALQGARTMCMEIDLMSDNKDKMKALIFNQDDNYSLRKLFDSSQYAMVDRFFQDSLHFSLAPLDKAKPFMLTTLLMMKQVPCENQDIAAPDRELANLATNKKIPIATLETVESQMALFDSIPDKTEAEMIVRLVKDIKNNDKEARIMQDTWKQQDLDKLYKLIVQSPDLKGYQDLMLFRRNAAWIPQLEQLMSKGPVFVAVGAAHLAGDKGLIILLRKEGYKVEAVN
ncbi:TraB/GumN family protein [Chitinophaga varians]|uniref:TraB/GumN family protein n=1 Tax=Chitinophaga varians TaxID=2202339 RepID=UPI00165F0C3C|nr:TraB/GumN family protein [Chitinophaga varians]MBC9912828.1 TraB/GumN family protein [Chitinophaga varians]